MADQFIVSPTQSTLQLHPWQTSSLHHRHKALYNSTFGRPVHYITDTKHFTTPPLADQFITSPTQSTLQLHPWQTSSLHHQHKALYNSTLGRPVHYITNTKHFTIPPLADQFITSPTQSTLQFHPWQTSSLHHQHKALYNSTLGRPVHYITNTNHFTTPPLADQFITSPTQSTLQLHPWQTSSLHHQHKALYNSTLGRPVHYITKTKHFTTPPLADQFITSPTQITLQLHPWQTSSLYHQDKALYNSTLGRPVHYITNTKHFTTPPLADQFITSPTQSTLQLHPWQTSSLHHQHKALYNSTLGRPVHYITKTKHFTTPPLSDQFITSPTQSTLQLHPWQTSSLHHQDKALYNSTLGRPVHYITDTKHFTTPPLADQFITSPTQSTLQLQPLADQFITSPTQSTLQLHPWQTSSLYHRHKALYNSTLGRPVHCITDTKHFTTPPLADQFIISPRQNMF